MAVAPNAQPLKHIGPSESDGGVERQLYHEWTNE